MTTSIPAKLRFARSLAALLLAASVSGAAASEFQLHLPDGATSSELDATLGSARAHRKLYPEDTIIIALPTQLSRTAPIALGVQDSGRKDAPLILRGAPKDGSTITGAVVLESEGGLDLSAEPVSRMPAAVRGLVRRLRIGEDVAAKTKPAFTPNGSFMQGAVGRLFLFEGDRRLEPARWPSTGYAASPVVVAGAPDSLTIRLPEDVAGLEREADLWVAGFWGWNWWFETRKVISISGRMIGIAKPEAPVRPGARYRLINLAAGLDRSGVYYRDAPDGSVYFIPGEANRAGRLSVAIADSLLKINGASNIRVENVAFEKTVRSAVTIENSENITLRDCYVGHTGTNGIEIGGNNNLVENCVVDDIGQTGIAIAGGDRNTLTPSNDIVRHNTISRFGREMPTYRPGVRLDGVGVTIEGCEIANASHAGIMFGGNDHQIVGNIFHDLVLDADDSGAIYAGRNWTYRGTVIASNYFYDITNRVDASSVRGVYLDDQLSGTEVQANVFNKVDEPILVGGGRDNVIRDNFAIASKGSPIRVDSRGLNWEADMVKQDGALRKGLAAVPYKEGVWAQRYPGLENILDDRLGAPVNNSFVDNLDDQGPVIKYDRRETAAFGTETGSREIGELALDFPASLKGVPTDLPATRKLEETRTLIDQTMQAMRNLPFREKLGE